jgi:hypothetical protein
MTSPYISQLVFYDEYDEFLIKSLQICTVRIFYAISLDISLHKNIGYKITKMSQIRFFRTWVYNVLSFCTF